MHEQAAAAITVTLHRLFSSGYATISPDNKDMAIITEKGHAALAAQDSRNP